MKIKYMGYKLGVEILYYTPEDPGYTSGLPEDCYPPESAEVDWKFEEEDSLAAQLIYETEDLFKEVTDIILNDMEQDRIDTKEVEDEAIYSLRKEEGL